MRQKHKEELAQQEKQTDAQLEVLKLAVKDPSITPEAREAAFTQMEELTSGKGKKKSGFSFKNLLGQFQDVGQQPTAKQPAQRQAQAPTPQAASIPPVPGRETTPAASAAIPPVPTRRFRTPEEMNQQRISEETASLEAKRGLEKKWRAEDAEMFVDAINKAKTPEERSAVAAAYGIKLPLQHFQAATVKMPDGSVRPAGYDPNTGQYIDPENGLALAGAVKYVKPTTTEEKKEGLINSYIEATGASRQDAERWYAQQNVRIQEAKGAPQTSTSTVVETTPEGPAITRKTTTTRGPAGATPSQRNFIRDFQKSHGAPTSTGPQVDTGVADGKVQKSASIVKPSSLSLPWALPKEGRAAIRKATDDYETAKVRYDVMSEMEEKIKRDPRSAGQGDVAILFNHIAMTMGAKTSIRPTRLMVEDAKKARTIPEGIQVSYQGNFVSGASLSPAQRHYMVELAATQMRAQQRRLLDEQVRYGLKKHVITKDGTKGYIDTAEFKAHPDKYSEIQ